VVKKPPIQARPPYPIESVDNALRIIQLLRDEGDLRIKDVASELGVAPSTVHRLMGMLIYRGFAMQDDSRRYCAGPALGARVVGSSWTRVIRQVLQPSLELLCSRLNETVNLMVRIGISTRFLTTVEAVAALRVGDRGGSVIPARLASGGKALLAYEPIEVLDRLYRGKGAELSGEFLGDVEFARLVSDLSSTRTRGFAINRAESESGIGAIGLAIPMPTGKPVASFSVAVPLARLDDLLRPEKIAIVFEARAEMVASLAGADLEELRPL